MGQRSRAFPRHIPLHAHGRLVTAAVLGVATALVVPARLGVSVRLLAAWDAVALVMTIFAWMIILPSGPQETHRHAGTHDPGRRAVSVLVILTSGVSLLATAVILRQARRYPPDVRWLFVALCVLTVAGAWVLTHSAYALRYAHLYYRDDEEGVGGLTFPDEAAPCYLDFAYFAFTIGMCFQVSDVSVPSRQIRRAVLGHSVLSFLYNTAILATAINLAVGVFG
ncbi:MAG TPA: DUF1345 domain-containing protein [Polyangia bacterium]|jgi:uncharacterized membrane protein|nr:DUF1345 domain-containing protein [Polyangia bacterium]